MGSNINITNLAEKLKLLLRSERSAVKTEAQLLIKLGIGKDYLSRIKSGVRVLPEEKLVELCSIFSVPQLDWFLPLKQFGEKLGFSMYDISVISGTHLPGIDLNSRDHDYQRVSNLFQIMQGFWESYYYSVSKVDVVLVSCDLLIVQRVTPDCFIECEIVDGLSTYTGWCFPIPNHLYFILEKKQLFNEVIVYATNLPERIPPRLYGVILCLSGGVDEHHSFPASAKVAFRYLGSENDIRKEYGLEQNINVRAFMEEKVPRYIDPTDEAVGSEVKEILSVIHNVVLPTTIPNALRMTE